MQRDTLNVLIVEHTLWLANLEKRHRGTKTCLETKAKWDKNPSLLFLISPNQDWFLQQYPLRNQLSVKDYLERRPPVPSDASKCPQKWHHITILGMCLITKVWNGLNNFFFFFFNAAGQAVKLFVNSVIMVWMAYFKKLLIPLRWYVI